MYTERARNNSEKKNHQQHQFDEIPTENAIWCKDNIVVRILLLPHQIGAYSAIFLTASLCCPNNTHTHTQTSARAHVSIHDNTLQKQRNEETATAYVITEIDRKWSLSVRYLSVVVCCGWAYCVIYFFIVIIILRLQNTTYTSRHPKRTYQNSNYL